MFCKSRRQQRRGRRRECLCLLIVISLAQVIAAGAFIYSSCTQEKYQPNSLFQQTLNSLLYSLSAFSSQEHYSALALGNGSSGTPEGAAFGLYQCREDLQKKACSACIATLISQIVLLCPGTYGATLQLDRCFLRFEHFDFLGKLDTSLAHSRCSKSRIDDVELVRRKDVVLGDLGAAEGFRVSFRGGLEGYAQCLGDLSGVDCSSCLTDAAGKVSSLCGSAAAGDVFLSTCYVRYWESGYYENSPDSSGDGAGKTVAIIIGVVVGVAVITVLLSLCRRALG